MKNRYGMIKPIWSALTDIDSYAVKGAGGGVKIEYIFISLYDEGHRDLHKL